MFCMKCGKEIPNESTVCPECGAQTAPPQTPPPAANATAGAASTISNAVAAFSALSKRTIAKIAVVIALVAFFLPFVTVSCNGGGKDLKETYSGFSLMTGMSSDDDEIASQSKDDGKTNIWLFGSAGTAVAALVVLCLKKKSKIAAICNAVSLGCLALFRLTFKGYYDIKGSDYEKYIDVDFRFGLTICALFLIISLIYCLISHTEEQSNSGKTPTSNAPNTTGI